MKYYIDTETCGLHGMPVILQYAIDDGPVVIHELWRTPIRESVELIEKIASETVIGFNLAFDWFQLYKFWTTARRYAEINDAWDAHPQDDINGFALEEKEARDYPLCLKPAHVMDLMLHARKGPYQSLMDRDEIRIRRVPSSMAALLAKALNERLKFKDVYFERMSDKKARWRITDIKDEETGEIENDFQDIVLTFAPSSSLKALATDALNLKEDNVMHFADVEISEEFRPVEYGYAPFALAGVYDKTGNHLQATNQNNWRGTWPEVIEHHISHWAFYDRARQYASDDIVYTRGLYNYFNQPPLDDTDSVLACMVAVCRWRGYKIDVEGVLKLKQASESDSKSAPTAASYVRPYLEQVMSNVEKVAIRASTKKVILEEVAAWRKENADGKLELHPAAIRAQAVLDARQAGKRVELYEKLLHAGRFHASFVVIGTLSTRMAGSDGLNPQGINKNKETRSKFPLAFPGMILSGGDFSAFEVTIAEAVFQDPELRAELLKGKKVHALFGAQMYPGETYESILASDGTDHDLYKPSKSGFFALIYGGTEYTLMTRLGIDEQSANEGFQRFLKRYKGIAKARQDVTDKFCTMRQPGGIGSKVEWHEPHDYIESFLGFRRYFTLENSIAKVLFKLGENPPPEWKNIKHKVVRRDRQQTAYGAAQSACFGAAFGIMNANMRAANNHLIQSPGAQITKELQQALWGLQPSGVSRWVIQPMNIHDEIMAPLIPEVQDKALEIVNSFVESKRTLVPLIKMDWCKHLESWASK